MGGGRGKLTLIFTSAIVEMGTAIANAKRIVPKSNLFIVLTSLFSFHPETSSLGLGIITERKHAPALRDNTSLVLEDISIPHNRLPQLQPLPARSYNSEKPIFVFTRSFTTLRAAFSAA